METRTYSSGIGLFSVIGVVFVILKLAGVGAIAAWSWWLVLLPFYGPILFALGIAVVVGLIILLASVFSD